MKNENNNEKINNIIDYIPGGLTLDSKYSKAVTLPFAHVLPDIANSGSNSSQLGVDNLTYRNDSSDSDRS
jgi:hypothetical protein